MNRKKNGCGCERLYRTSGTINNTSGLLNNRPRPAAQSRLPRFKTTSSKNMKTLPDKRNKKETYRNACMHL